jgi:hypothetical protein
MINLLSLLLCVGSAVTAAFRPTTTTVDLIELNHVQFDHGGGFSQVILWTWSPDYRRYDSVGWYLVDVQKLETLPYKKGDRWIAKHCDGKNYILQFDAGIFRETRTKHDPERENRKLRP